jgi:hypothetical protein
MKTPQLQTKTRTYPCKTHPPQVGEEKSPEEVAELIAKIEKTIDDIVDRQRERNGSRQESEVSQN